MAHNDRRLEKNIRSTSMKRRQVMRQHKDSPDRTVFSVLFSIGAAMAIVLGFIFISTAVHTHSTTTAAPENSSSSTLPAFGSLNHPKGWCGNNAQQPTCPSADSGWFSVSSVTPAAIATAISQSSNFRAMMNQFGYTALDTPVWVHAIFAHTGINYYDDDHWVVSVVNASGRRCGVFDFIFDRTHQTMSFSSFGVVTATDPHATSAFPYTSASAASKTLQQQRDLLMAPNSTPELVFFPIDPNFRNLNSPVHLWAGSGDSPMDPIWLLTGTDDHEYFVGIDQHVYTQTDLPVARSRP